VTFGDYVHSRKPDPNIFEKGIWVGKRSIPVLERDGTGGLSNISRSEKPMMVYG
jgi:hypothetical protein